MGGFKVTMMLSAIMAAVSAVINLSAFVCVYDATKEIVQSLGDFTMLNRDYLIESGWKAVLRISIAFGTKRSVLSIVFPAK